MPNKLSKFTLFQPKIQISLIVLLFSFSLVLNSCKKDDNKNIDRSSFFGDWKVASNCGNGYTVTITASASNASDINLHGLENFGSDLTATVSGSTFTFTDQELNGFETVTGTGTLNADEETISVSYTDDSNNSCSGTWTKQ
jgi:hypothetical protein